MGNPKLVTNLTWILDVVPVVPDKGLIVEGEGITNVDTGTDIARFAIGMTCHVPVRRIMSVGKFVEGAVFCEVGGFQGGELVSEEVFRSGLGLDVAGGENGSFVCVVTVGEMSVVRLPGVYWGPGRAVGDVLTQI